MPPQIGSILSVVVTAGLTWSALVDLRSRRIPWIAGYGVLSAGLLSLLLSRLWLPAAFYVAAIWATGGGLRRLPMMLLTVPLFVDERGISPMIMGILFVAAIFEMGWSGGGDAQLAFGLVALARDWWIFMYLFGGTILLALTLVFVRCGFRAGLKRLWWVAKHLEATDEAAIHMPWAIIAALGGVAHFWIHPGLAWR